MKAKFQVTICAAALTFFTLASSAQSVAINNTGTAADASAALDVTSTSQGVLLPRITTVQKNGIAAPAKGLIVYDSTLKAFNYWDGAAWTAIGSGSGSNYWALAGTTLYNTTATANRVLVGDSTATFKNTASLNVVGIPFTNASGGVSTNALFLGAGQAGATSNCQILFGMQPSAASSAGGLAQHAIKTRHSTSANAGNVMDFYVYTTGANVAGPNDKAPFKNTMLINGEGKMSVNNIASTGTVAATPHSNLQVNGSFAAAILTGVTTSQTLDAAQYCIITSETATITLTLPSVATSYAANSLGNTTATGFGNTGSSVGANGTGFAASGREYIIVNKGTGAVTINDATAVTLFTVAAGARLQIICDGTSWTQIN